MKVKLLGTNQTVELRPQDLVGKGGQGEVYAQNDTAFKIYTDPADMIPPAKLRELAALTHPAIVRPADVLIGPRGVPVGYTMPFVRDAMPLVRAFPKAFKQREGLVPDRVQMLVLHLREVVEHVHSCQVLIVDLNEMNVLLTAGFDTVRLIDVDSWQTKSYPATALMESVRDRRAVGFNAGTDWFAFAVVTFQLFVGIHPYRGRHPSATTLDERMQANLSVFNQAVSYPQGPVLPFDVIPPHYRQWYEAVFEHGLRDAPPSQSQRVVPAAAVTVRQIVGAQLVRLTLMTTLDTPIIGRAWTHSCDVLVADHFHVNGRKTVRAEPGAVVGFSPDHHPLAAWVRAGKLQVMDLKTEKHLTGDLQASSVFACNNRLYTHHHTGIHEIEIGQARYTARKVANAHQYTTRGFPGVAVQQLLGRYFATFFPASGQSRLVPLPELDGYALIDAKQEGHVLVLIGRQIATGRRQGRYDRLVMRFSDDWQQHDCRIVEDVQYVGINFCVLDSGVAVLIDEEDRIEVFRRKLGSTGLTRIEDPAVSFQWRLFSNGSEVLAADGARLMRLQMEAGR